jgi:hypothetical protein
VYRNWILIVIVIVENIPGQFEMSIVSKWNNLDRSATVESTVSDDMNECRNISPTKRPAILKATDFSDLTVGSKSHFLESCASVEG